MTRVSAVAAAGVCLVLALAAALWVAPPPWQVATVETRFVLVMVALLVGLAGALPLLIISPRASRPPPAAAAGARRAPRALRPLVLLTLVCVVSSAPSCRASRQPDALAVEGWAAVLRQEEAAQELVRAAEEARSAGDVGRCVSFLQPALEIEARARHQWARGLHLARLDDGPDPGPSPPVRSAELICAGDEPVKYLSRSPR